MDAATLARLGAVIFVAIAGTAAVVEMSREEEAPEPPIRTVEAEHDPLRGEQRRCQRLGELAAQDIACLKVWAQTRDRFLGRPASIEGR